MTFSPPSDPSAPSAPSAETWLHKVQMLLAKAESTEFTEEAEALMAKAQQIMSRHAIDEAMLAAAGRSTDTVEVEEIVVEPPYASPKSSLLAAVAAANHCRVVSGPGRSGRRRCSVVGHRSDIANVRTLFASLSVQAARLMLHAPVPPHDTPRRFRHSFLLAFAGRIDERLGEARRQAEQDKVAEAGSGVAVVLASRHQEVDEAFREAFPRVRTSYSRATSAAGWAGGRAAADRAGLGQPGVRTGSAGRLGSGR